MLGLILDLLAKAVSPLVRLGALIYGRRGKMQGALAELEHLHGQLVMFAFQANQYAGEFDLDLIIWAEDQILGHSHLANHSDYGKVAPYLFQLKDKIEGYRIAWQLNRGKDQGISKFFPALGKPYVDNSVLSKRDRKLFAEVKSIIESINSSSSDLKSLHDNTFASNISDYQVESIRLSFVMTYRNISVQSRRGADKLAQMGLMAPSKT